ncbi:hypothetical protein [Lysobacter enzymogenes]|uniref:hypothetical protein n=1 Tax=Lysobacter enzymogenes TaxID=69 RepID=UPI001AF61A42|nr:hypothetical protein [Lysobacter enzymogenes]QQQ00506.1 hypothetical protein JHW41_20850 [Lysobacter enzymogenes]
MIRTPLYPAAVRRRASSRAPRNHRPRRMDGCHFHIEILAPSGLSGIEAHLADCAMPLQPYRSGFNDQVILRHGGDIDEFEFAMDPSTTGLLHASGSIFREESQAWRMVESLSRALRLAGFAHRAGMDNAAGDGLFREIDYRWGGT